MVTRQPSAAVEKPLSRRGPIWAVLAILFTFTGLGQKAEARSVGPDIFGYLATDAVPFAFEDISGTGTLTLAGTDDGVFVAPLGFAFIFYDQSFTQVSWSANGLITFGGTNSQFGNSNLSTTRTIGDKPSIAVLWDDWQFFDPRTEGVYYEMRGVPGGHRFIVQWTKAIGVDTLVDTVTFQAILFEGTNTILLQYLDVDSGDERSAGAQATVGIRDTGGQLNGRSLVWSYNAAAISDGQAIRFGTSLDTSAPAVTIEAPVEGAVIGGGEVTVTARVVDASETVVVSAPSGIEAALPAGGGTVSGSIPLTEGPNAIVLSAVDAAGNSGGTSIAIVRDTLPPRLSGASPAAGSVVGESPISFSVMAGDATPTTLTFGGNSFRVFPPGGPATGQVALLEGINTVLVAATDAAGNATTLAVEITLDLAAPIVTIDSPRDGECFGPGLTLLPVVVTVDDLTETTVTSAPAGFSGSIPPGGGVLPGAIPLVEGANAFTITASDVTGRSGSASMTVFSDGTSPRITLESPADGYAVRGTIDLGAQASDAGCGISFVEFLVDGKLRFSLAAEPFATLLDTASVSDGPHLVEAVAFDVQGNTASDGAQVFVDNLPPSISVVRPPDGAQVSGILDFSVQASDGSGSGLVALEVLANGIPPSGMPSTAIGFAQSLTELSGLEDTTRWPDGPLTFTATARDAAGNRTMTAITVRVANSVPATVSLTPADGSVVSGIFPITIEVRGAEVDFIEVLADEVSLGRSGSAPFTVEFDSTKRLDGGMTIAALVSDAAGQVTRASAFVTVDNMSVQLMPSLLSLHHKGAGVVLARVEGPNVRLLRLLERSRIELRVPGGSPVTAEKLPGKPKKEDRERAGRSGASAVLARFQRASLVASIRAGIASGTIDPEEGVEVELVADGCLLGTVPLQLRLARER